MYYQASTVFHVFKLKVSLLISIQNSFLQYIPSSRQQLCVVKSRNWDSLKILNLYKCKIRDYDVPVITTKKWQHLKQLNIGQNPIGSKGVKLLIKADLPQIQSVYLSCCRIKNCGAVHLAKANWPNLQQLWIAQNNIGFEGFQSFIKFASNKAVKIDIQLNQFTPSILFLTASNAIVGCLFYFKFNGDFNRNIEKKVKRVLQLKFLIYDD